MRDGRPIVNNTFELEHDLVINALSTEVRSVGAGGGSIVSISPSGDVLVGPASAGADPGPACYGRGGEAPTLTDACLLIGILDAEGFAGGAMRLDADRARQAFEALDTPLPLEQRVSFAYRIAAANVAEEVTDIAIRHGVDPRDFSLVAYGAAGPMLLPATLDLLHVKRIIVPPHPGLFSALGLLSADLVYSDSRSAYVMLGPDTAPRWRPCSRRWRSGCANASGAGRDDVEIRRSFDGRLFGQSWETPFIEVPDGPIDERHDPRAGRALPRGVRAALREPVPDAAGAGRHLSRPARRARGQGRVRADSTATARQAPAPTRMLELRYLADGAARRRPSTIARRCRREPRRRPGDHPGAALDDVRLPRAGRDGGRRSARS